MTVGDLTEFSRRFDGKPMNRPWMDVKMGWDPDMSSMPKGDYPSLVPSVPVFTRKAVSALRDILEANGEILPVKIAGEEYYFYNLTRIIDALDEIKSTLDRYDDGRVFYIDDYSFFADKLVGATIFKIPQMPGSWIYVNDVFVQRVQKAKLKGFWFPLMWSGGGS